MAALDAERAHAISNAIMAFDATVEQILTEVREVTGDLAKVRGIPMFAPLHALQRIVEGNHQFRD